MHTANVAILLASHNGEKYIVEQIDSLLAQSYQDFVCYIHDDGSMDGTCDIIKHYEEKYPQKIKVLKYISDKQGAKYNFMSMLKYVREPYVMFCDQDDIWHNDKIEETLKEMQKLEEKKDDKVLVFSDLEVVDERKNLLVKSFIHFNKRNPYENSPEYYFITNNAPGCTMMLNKNLYQIINKCNNIDDIEVHDQWCMLVASIFGKIGYVNKSLLYYRQHRNNSIGAKKYDTIPDRFVNISYKLLKGTYFSTIQETLAKQRKQAYVLLNLDDVPQKYKKILQDILNSKYWNKFNKLIFYYKTRLKYFIKNLLYYL